MIAGQDVIYQLGIGGLAPVLVVDVLGALLQRLQLRQQRFGIESGFLDRRPQLAVAGAAEIEMIGIEQARRARDMAGQLAQGLIHVVHAAFLDG